MYSEEYKETNSADQLSVSFALAHQGFSSSQFLVVTTEKQIITSAILMEGVVQEWQIA